MRVWTFRFRGHSPIVGNVVGRVVPFFYDFSTEFLDMQIDRRRRSRFVRRRSPA
jgi:hypothetical protein